MIYQILLVNIVSEKNIKNLILKTGNLEILYVISIEDKNDFFDFFFLDDIQLCILKVSNYRLPDFLNCGNDNYGCSTNFLRINDIDEEKFSEKILNNINESLEKNVTNKIISEYQNEHQTKIPTKLSVFRFSNREGLFCLNKENINYPLFLRTNNKFHPVSKSIISYPSYKSVHSYYSVLFDIKIKPFGSYIFLTVPNLFTFNNKCRSFIAPRIKYLFAHPNSLLDNNIENLNIEDITGIQD